MIGILRKIMLLLCLLLLNSCGHKSSEPLEFIEESKNIDLDILFDVSIEARNKSDDKFHYYYSYTFTKGDTLTIPSYEYFDDFYAKDSALYDIAFANLKGAKGETKIPSFNYAQQYAQKLDKIYQDLNVVSSKSNTKNGEFIEFTLSEGCVVYYLKDDSTLSPQWKNRLDNMVQVDGSWYYDCN